MVDPRLLKEIGPYIPWLIIVAVFVLFFLLRYTRKALRQRIDEIGYRMMGERGLHAWFWLNAPGVILHELSHAFVVCLFRPFGFRITEISFFRIKPMAQQKANGAFVQNRRRAVQLGEVRYARPEGRFMSYVGDGLSGIAPFFGGVAVFTLLYWLATGYSLWQAPIDAQQHFQLFNPDWPRWTLIFAPYLIFTVTSELWPSRQDWHGARWFVGGLTLLIVVLLGFVWYMNYAPTLLDVSTLVASRVNFALLILILLDLMFLCVAEVLVRVVRR